MARDSLGDTIEIYGGACHFSNMTEYCPEVDGLLYNDQIIEVMTSMVDLTVWDGVFCDGIWRNAYDIDDIDLDLSCPVNGGAGDPENCNDYDEHGEDWIEDAWLDGVNKATTAIREQNGDKILILNSGRFHEFEWENTNGFYVEHVGCVWSMCVWLSRNSLISLRNLTHERA